MGNFKECAGRSFSHFFFSFKNVHNILFVIYFKSFEVIL